MDHRSYFSSYLSGRFGDVSGSDEDEDGFGENMPDFLKQAQDDNDNRKSESNNQNDEILETQEVDQNSQITEKTPVNDKINKSRRTNPDLKEKGVKSIDEIDSSILMFGQFFSPEQISESFIRRPFPSPDLISDRMKVLLYDDQEISKAMKRFFKIRHKRKEYSIDSFEEFILLFINKHFPGANEDTISRFRQLFWGGHQVNFLLKSLLDIHKSDPNIFINEFANSMAELEKDYVDFEFSMDELNSAGLHKETYDMWKRSIEEQNAQKSVQIPEKPELLNVDSEKLEQIDSYLSQTFFSPKSLAKLSSADLNDDIEITLRSTVIGDRNEDVDVNLSLVDTFQVEENHELLCILMLKDDMCFYIENVRERPIVVNGYNIMQDQITYVLDQSLIQFGNLSFIFSINQALFSKLSKILETNA